jgi:hypothetical protein
MWQSKDSDIPTMYAAQTHNEACVRSEEHKNENPGVLRYEDMGGEFMFAHYVYCTKKEIFVDEAPEAK